MKPYDVVIWDWNGTLLDDREVCIATVNAMLEKRKLPVLTEEQYREVFTFPVRDYYSAVGFDFQKEPFEELAVEYMAGYNEGAVSCQLFPGVKRVLGEIEALGIPQVICSASDDEALRKQMEPFSLREISCVLGMKGILASGKEGLAAGYLKEQGFSPERCLFVGDTVHDFEIAQDLGAACALIADGHQNRERLEATGAVVLDHVDQLPVLLAEECWS